MAITFNGVTKIITLSSGTTTLGVRDLWSRWVDWLLTGDNSKYAIAFTQTGGDVIDSVAGTFIPVYMFMQNGWKIKPQEANHTLKVEDGILIGPGGGDPFINTTGSFQVRVNYSQPVQAITVSTGGGGSSGASVDDIWQRTIESGLNAEEAMRIILAVLVGKVSGAGTSEEVFRDVNDTKDRVIISPSAEGNRLNVVLDKD
jgi:hypothetical protein